MITKNLTIATILLLLITGCGKKDEGAKTKESREVTKTETKAQTPNVINLKTIDEKDIKLTALENGIKFENYPNKIVLLDFFATWCPPCRAEIPHLNIIQDVFKEHVQIIGVLMEESKSNEDIAAFSDDLKMNFPITNSPANFALSDALGGIKSLPTMVMYDKNGEYFTHYVGAAPQEMIEADIQKAIEKTK
jgi:thiol-disulfide isomerase/thioredoxin